MQPLHRVSARCLSSEGGAFNWMASLAAAVLPRAMENTLFERSPVLLKGGYHMYSPHSDTWCCLYFTCMQVGDAPESVIAVGMFS